MKGKKRWVKKNLKKGCWKEKLEKSKDRLKSDNVFTIIYFLLTGYPLHV